MGCGWLGALFEWEGVIIEDNHQLEKQAWLALTEEEGKSPPPAFILRRIEGMKNEQAISEVLLRDGSQEFVNTLTRYEIPVALVSTRRGKVLEAAIRAIGMEGFFSVIVAAEDVHRGKPDSEMFVYAAQLLQFTPERCIVFGNSNQTVEAAHDARMKCVAIASKHPVYELGAADFVVNHLDELLVFDLKNLADIESAEFGSEEPELEMEEEEYRPSASIAVDDIFW
ncbi:glutamate--cysteine ligase [Hibiscus syriacus]|uniref:Glutamate--cysteine ligase n=1 Tax=Hibiscus syriacus TaxID=106335 RepID=A0A6A2WUP9_HIBSY|nr:glutamate--cysteine ligase [Hibiscus syriacus]